MGTPRLTIREARPAEFEAIGRLAVAAYRSLGPIPEPYEDELLQTALRAAAVPVLVAVDEDGALLGTVTYVPGPGTPYSEHERDDEAGMRVLAVAPSALGRGIGRALAEAVLARARDTGRGGVALYTRPSMTAAHQLYASLGFRRVPDADWQFEPGEWLWGYRLRF